MEANSDEPILTLDDDLEGDISSFRHRAREALAARRRRLIDLQKQITEQSRTIAGEIQRDQPQLESRQAALNRQRDEVEQQLAHLESLRGELSHDRSQWDTQQSQVIQRQEKLLADLCEQHERLESVRTDLDRREKTLHEQLVRFEHDQTTFFSLQLQQAERDEGLDRAFRDLEAERTELAKAREELAEQEAALRLRQTELEEQRQALENQQVELKSLAESTHRQRKQLASQFRQRKAESLAEIRQRKAEVDDIAQADEGQLRREVEAAHQQCQQLRDEVSRRETRIEELARQVAKAEQQYEAAARKLDQAEAAQQAGQANLQQLQQQLQEALGKHEVYEAKLEDRLAQLTELREENQNLRDAVKGVNDQLAAAREEMENIRGQITVFQQQYADSRDSLKLKEEEIAKLQQALANAERGHVDETDLRKQLQAATRQRDELQAQLDQQLANASNSNHAADDELRKRYQVALDDVRELKKANRELTEQLQAASKSTGQAAPAPAGDALDWESQKKRLLAELEDEADDGSPGRKSERLSIEETIRITDRLIAEKDEEIRELRQLLDDQSSNIGGMAVGANAIAAMLDSDELIREERENLKQLQDQWREKLRQAELDMSMERAKIGRERSELEERISHFQKERAKLEKELNETLGDPAKKPSKRKWMERLGLKADDDA